MKTWIIVIVIIAVVVGIFIINNNTSAPALEPETKNMQTLKITSTAFENSGNIPPKYTCDGEDVNPPLSVENIPAEAKSLAIIFDDPDAPAGTWTHWTVWNIEPASIIAEANAPKGSTEGETSFGETGYGGPCPHSGSHRYFFKVYALDTKLDLPPKSSISELAEAIKGHTVAYGELMGRYERVK